MTPPPFWTRLLGLAACVVLAAGLTACENDNVAANADLIAGKKAFAQKCSACHVLARANAKGTQGPNLDEAFRQSLRDGFGRDTIHGVVEDQILLPGARSEGQPGLHAGRPRDRQARQGRRLVRRLGGLQARQGRGQARLRGPRGRRRQARGRQERQALASPPIPTASSRTSPRRRPPRRAPWRSTPRTTRRSRTTSRSRATASTRRARPSRAAASRRSASRPRPASTSSTARSRGTARAGWKARSPSSRAGGGAASRQGLRGWVDYCTWVGAQLDPAWPARAGSRGLVGLCMWGMHNSTRPATDAEPGPPADTRPTDTPSSMPFQESRTEGQRDATARAAPCSVQDAHDTPAGPAGPAARRSP